MANSKNKILILEDQTEIAKQIYSNLLKFGYEVTNLVSSYEEAIQSVKKNPPNIALCDIKILGYKDGIQTARDIKKIVDIPIIYLTAFLDRELKNRAVETKPAGYLIKPINYAQLDISIQIALQNHNNHTVINSVVKDERYYVWDEGVYEIINISDILWVKAENVSTQIITSHKIYYLASKSIKTVTAELLHPDIMRVSRSEAVNLKKIKQFDRKFSYVVMNTDELRAKEKISNVVYITDSHREEFKRRMGF